MAKVTVFDWDPTEIIVKIKEDVLAFLEGALKENNPKFLLKTIGISLDPKVWSKLPRN